MRTNRFRLIFILTVFSFSISCSKTLTPGKYKTNFATYGRFGKILTLNCDSTVIFNFAGDLMNDNSYGKWKTAGDTLLITFDTLNHPNSRYNGNLNLRIKGHKLVNILFTRNQYNEIVKQVKESGNDTLKLPSYRKMIRKSDRNMANFNGKMKRQYFEIIEEFDCEK